MTDPQKTYERLRVLAKDQAGTPEGVMAAALADKLQFEHRIEERESVRLAFANAYERDVLLRVALYLELEAFTVSRPRTDGKGNRVLEVIELQGPACVVVLAKPLYAQYRELARKFLEHSLTGYLFGALPVPPPPDLDSREAADVSPEDMEVLVAGMNAGAKSVYRKQIGENS